MSNTPQDLRYTKDHEWCRVNGLRVTVGLTDFAQRQLGSVVYVELPKVGDELEAGEPFGSVESVKAVSELYMPVRGTVNEVNEALADDPEQVNDDPYDGGWFIRLTARDAKEFDGLLSAAEYDRYISEEAE